MTGPTEGELSLDGAKDARAIKRLAGLHYFQCVVSYTCTYGFSKSLRLPLIACLPMSSDVVRGSSFTDIDCSSVRYLISQRPY